MVEGRLIDEVSGKPVGEGCRLVQLHGQKGPKYLAAVHRRRGQVSTAFSQPGTYNIWATAPPNRVCTPIYDFVVAGGKTYTAPDMKFVEGGWLEGHVVDADSGKPLTKVDADGGKPLTQYDKIGAKLMVGSSPRPRGKLRPLRVRRR